MTFSLQMHDLQHTAIYHATKLVRVSLRGLGLRTYMHGRKEGRKEERRSYQITMYKGAARVFAQTKFLARSIAGRAGVEEKNYSNTSPYFLVGVELNALSNSFPVP